MRRRHRRLNLRKGLRVEDRLAKSLRAAHDRQVEHLAAEPPVCKPPYEHHWYAVHAPHHDTQAAPVAHHDPNPSQETHGPAPLAQSAARVVPADLPAAAPVSRVAPLPHQEISRAPFGRRFRWQGNSVSIVGTVVLSILISTGLFSLQMISKWRRPKPVEATAKVMGLDQPLTIASAQDEPAPFDESADSAAAKASPSPVQSPADSSVATMHGLTAVITPASNNDATNNRSAVDMTSHRALRSRSDWFKQSKRCKRRYTDRDTAGSDRGARRRPRRGAGLPERLAAGTRR